MKKKAKILAVAASCLAMGVGAVGLAVCNGGGVFQAAAAVHDPSHELTEKAFETPKVGEEGYLPYWHCAECCKTSADEARYSFEDKATKVSKDEVTMPALTGATASEIATGDEIVNVNKTKFKYVDQGANGVDGKEGDSTPWYVKDGDKTAIYFSRSGKTGEAYNVVDDVADQNFNCSEFRFSVPESAKVTTFVTFSYKMKDWGEGKFDVSKASDSDGKGWHMICQFKDDGAYKPLVLDSKMNADGAWHTVTLSFADSAAAKGATSTTNLTDFIIKFVDLRGYMMISGLSYFAHTDSHALTEKAFKTPTTDEVGNVPHWRCEECSEKFGTDTLFSYADKTPVSDVTLAKLEGATASDIAAGDGIANVNTKKFKYVDQGINGPDQTSKVDGVENDSTPWYVKDGDKTAIYFSRSGKTGEAVNPTSNDGCSEFRFSVPAAAKTAVSVTFSYCYRNWGTGGWAGGTSASEPAGWTALCQFMDNAYLGMDISSKLVNDGAWHTVTLKYADSSATGTVASNLTDFILKFAELRGYIMISELSYTVKALEFADKGDSVISSAVGNGTSNVVTGIWSPKGVEYTGEDNSLQMGVAALDWKYVTLTLPTFDYSTHASVSFTMGFGGGPGTRAACLFFGSITEPDSGFDTSTWDGRIVEAPNDFLGKAPDCVKTGNNWDTEFTVVTISEGKINFKSSTIDQTRNLDADVNNGAKGLVLSVGICSYNTFVITPFYASTF